MTDYSSHGNGHRKVGHVFEHRSPEEIQRELEVTRREMAHTIHAIENELSSGQIIVRAISFLRGAPLQLSKNFTQQAIQNPIPVALIGAGLLMLARGGSPSYRRSTLPHLSDETKHHLSETTHHLKDKVVQTKERAKVRAKEAVSRTGEKAHELRERSQETMRRSIHTAQRAWNENPMMVGLAALAAGALIAAALPTTRRERQVLGPRRDRLVDEAKRTAQEAVQGVKSGVKSGIESVQQEQQQLSSYPQDEVRPVDEPLTTDLFPEDYPRR
jgi:ElaB/YqjD/DUF883 family membrane-anchored ribosome-binding protein